MGFNLSGNWMSFPRVAYITMAWVILMLYYIRAGGFCFQKPIGKLKLRTTNTSELRLW